MNDYEVFVEYNTNFNPNDGVSTEHIIGGPQVYGGYADYCILEQDGEIISSWFVIENIRTRGGQYRVMLKRDGIADYYEKVMTSPCFVEKGWVNDADSAIFNSENMTFNQIKKREVLLKDKTQTAWLVGYYAKGKTLTANIPELMTDADIVVNGIANWEYNVYRETPAKKVRDYNVELRFNEVFFPEQQPGNYRVDIDYRLENDRAVLKKADINEDEVGWYQTYKMLVNQSYQNVSLNQKTILALTAGMSNNAGTLSNSLSNIATGYTNNVEWQAIYDLGGSTIFDSETGIVYEIIAEAVVNQEVKGDLVSIGRATDFGYQMYNIYSEIDGIYGARPTSNGNGDFFAKVWHIDTVRLDLKIKSYASAGITITADADGQTRDCPYNIFAIPYGDDYRMASVSEKFNVYSNADLALRIMNALIAGESGTAGSLYDVQLLPYCPLPLLMEKQTGSQHPVIGLDAIPHALWHTIQGKDNAVLGVYFNVPSSSIQATINYTININNYKIQNETEFCRLCSPNWNGMFEFSPAKNRGVDYFTVDMELKPFQPYIHVAPKWNEGGLYGIRSNDPIGLICGGDFGLTMISDAWQTYERQNKNYQNIFDRQIQNLEVQNKYGKITDIVSGAVGTVQGGATSAMMGGMMGGPTGGIIGGVVGGALSAGGGIADFAINEALRNENMDYTKDQFGYQLGNIRALPDTLSRVNSFNPNNKIFPILEFYGCSDEETEALKQKIKYNGMSIGRIGKLRDFVNPEETTYVKGQLIVLDELPEDSHFANDIANEIYKGVRI
jgi:hypothetical protein